MSALRSFLPWLVYLVIPGWTWAAVVALAVTAANILLSRRAGHPLGSLLVEFVSAGYFAVVAVIAFSDPGSPFHHYVGAVSVAVLALMAWVSLAVRRPFTLGIARRDVPREYWDSPVFFRINVVISLVWAIAFTLTAAALFAADIVNAPLAVFIVVNVAGFAIPLLFTSRYTAAAKARVASRVAAAGQAASARTGTL